MVIGVFPLMKLGFLLIKQLSSPVAKFVKNSAKDSKFFRDYICMPPAQMYNWCEGKVNNWVKGIGKTVKIPKLSEQKAIELGANLLGETVIFLIAAGILFGEMARQGRKATAKEDAHIDEVESLKDKSLELYFLVEQQDAQLRELTRVIHELQSEVVHSPDPTHHKDSPPEDSPPEDSLHEDSPHKDSLHEDSLHEDSPPEDSLHEDSPPNDSPPNDSPPGELSPSPTSTTSPPPSEPTPSTPPIETPPTNSLPPTEDVSLPEVTDGDLISPDSGEEIHERHDNSVDVSSNK